MENEQNSTKSIADKMFDFTNGVLQVGALVLTGIVGTKIALRGGLMGLIGAIVGTAVVAGIVKGGIGRLFGRPRPAPTTNTNPTPTQAAENVPQATNTQVPAPQAQSSSNLPQRTWLPYMAYLAARNLNSVQPRPVSGLGLAARLAARLIP